MNYNYNGFYNNYEYEVPDWIGFDKTFRDSNEVRLQHKVEAFKQLHPHLTVMWSDQFNKTKIVRTGPVLFNENGTEYREIKYSFKVYGVHVQYQPSKELLEMLTVLDGITETRRLRRLCSKCPYKGLGLMCTIERWERKEVGCTEKKEYD